MQHFQNFAAGTFACGYNAVGRRNSWLDADPTLTDCPRCKLTDAWRTAWQKRTKTAEEIREDRFLAAKDKSRSIPDSWFVALVDGKVRMGLRTYEALVDAAAAPKPAAPDDRSSPTPRLIHHYRPGWFNAACKKKIADVQAIDSDWAKVTCPDCLSYYRPEDDPLAPKVEREDGPDYALADEAPDDRSSADVSINPHDHGEPLFQHDCGDCIFLTRFKGQDLYFHPGRHSDRSTTVIARRSGQGPDYVSGLAAAEQDPNLAVAYVIAHRRGLL